MYIVYTYTRVFACPLRLLIEQCQLQAVQAQVVKDHEFHLDVDFYIPNSCSVNSLHLKMSGGRQGVTVATHMRINTLQQYYLSRTALSWTASDPEQEHVRREIGQGRLIYFLGK